MKEPIFSLDDVSKVYDGHEVLRIEHLDIFPGEVLAIVGPSGAGKSSLLRLLNFLEPPTSGYIRFEGMNYGPDCHVALDVRRQVTTVFQRPLLLKRNVQRNVAFGLHLRGRRDGHADIQTALKRVGLQALAHQKANTLSGGEAQRVALARAIALSTPVLLLDEPTANLDPYNVSLIESIIEEVNQKDSTTIVLVTHNIFQARRLAHRVGLLLDGELIEVAEAEDFFDSPTDPRTTAFVRGEMVY